MAVKRADTGMARALYAACRAVALTGWIGLAGTVTAPTVASAQSAASGDLRVNLTIDERRNAQARRLISVEDIFPAYVYSLTRNADGGLRLQLADDKLMGLWKGDAVLTGASERLWESADQFAPALLVLEVVNDGNAPLEISRSYLRVADSQTDRQPFIRMADPEPCGGMSTGVNLWNDGWRTADNARLTWRFRGAGNLTSPEFSADLGSLGHVMFTPRAALESLMPALRTLGSPKCPSAAMLKSCLAALEKSGRLGRLAGLLRIDGEDPDSYSTRVRLTMTSTLSYQWKHHPSNELRTRQQRFEEAVQVFEFDIGFSPECGAPGPGEGGFNPIRLQNDAGNYQVALPYRGPVGVRGARRFELTLKADRASVHRFEVVVETSDGRVAVSPAVDLLYFVPTKSRSPMREVR